MWKEWQIAEAGPWPAEQQGLGQALHFRVFAPLLFISTELPPGESFYDKALPFLKKAWARRGRGRRDLATNPKYMDDFGR